MVQREQHQQDVARAEENAENAINTAGLAVKAVLDADSTAHPSKMRIARAQLESAMLEAERAQTRLDAQDPVHEQRLQAIDHELMDQYDQMEDIVKAVQQPQQIK